MDQDETVKAMELDQLVGGPRLNMLKAALPYMPSQGQMFLSVLIKAEELSNTLKLCSENAEEGLAICSLEKEEATPLDMLRAIKPYGSENEQEFIDLIENFMEGARLTKAYQETAEPSSKEGSGHKMSMFDMLKMMLPPQQTEKLEMYQMFMQAFQQGNSFS